MERGQCCCLAAGGSLGTHPISSHFAHFLCVTGVPLAVVLVLVPRVGGFVSILGPRSPFKQTLLRDRQFILPPNPHWFLQPDVKKLYFPGAGTLGCVVWPGAGITRSPGILPSFCLSHVNAGLPLPCCQGTMFSLPWLPVSSLLPIWLNKASLNHSLLDFHRV